MGRSCVVALACVEASLLLSLLCCPPPLADSRVVFQSERARVSTPLYTRKKTRGPREALAWTLNARARRGAVWEGGTRIGARGGGVAGVRFPPPSLLCPALFPLLPNLVALVVVVVALTQGSARRGAFSRGEGR